MKKNEKSLHRQIIMLMTALVIIPLLIASIVNFYAIKRNVEENFDTVSSASITNVVNDIGDLYERNQESVDMLSNVASDKNSMASAENAILFRENLNAILNSNKNVTNAYMLTANKQFYIVPNQIMSKDFNPTEMEWYKDAMAEPNKVILTKPYKTQPNGNYKVTFAKAVQDKSKNVLGVIGVDIELSQINKLVKDINIGDNGYIAIVDKNGTILANKDASLIGKNVKENNILQAVISSKSDTFDKKIDGLSYRIYKQTEPNTGYSVIGIVSSSEIRKEIIGSLTFNVIIMIAAIVLAILIGNAFIKKKISSPIKEAADILDVLSNRDYTIEIKKKSGLTREIESIIDGIIKTKNRTFGIIKGITKISEDLKEHSQSLIAVTEESSAIGEEIAKSVQQISDGSVSQSEKLSETSRLSERLGEMVDDSIKGSESIQEAALSVKEASKKGTDLVKELSTAFHDSYAANKEVVKEVQELENRSNQIGKITSVIKEITEQTNLLALNASIEAARAGAAGRGFAVVAEEVRDLAEESAKSASEIEKVIDEVKLSVNEVIDKLRQSTSLSDKTADNVERTMNSFEKIQSEIESLENIIQNVNQSLKEMKSDKDMLLANITEVAAVAEEAAASSEEVSASTQEQASGLQEITSSAENLNVLSDKLNAMVNRFKI